MHRAAFAFSAPGGGAQVRTRSSRIDRTAQRTQSSPWVITLQDFVSDEEAEAFKTTCEKHFNRSLAGDMLSPVRTSYQCWCSQNECEEHPRVRDVARRISELTRAPVRYMEPFQVVRYTHGQFYRAHHDQNSGWFTPQGVRV